MSELISGKEALIALANGEEVETKKKDEITWSSIGFFAVNIFKDEKWEFRLKPRTITINNIEIPAPFEPKEGEECCYLSDESVDGYNTISYNSDRYNGMVFGLYRVSEIKQVVAALRSVFNESN